MSQPILQTENLDIGYRRRRGPVFTVAAGINVSLEAGECVCLVGPNGAGKSTLVLIRVYIHGFCFVIL